MLEPEVTFKICIFGDGGVGKTTLTRRYLSGFFEMDTKMTLGAEIFVKYVSVKDMKVVLQIWDFGGEDMFRFLLPAYSRGSSGGIFMYDITRYQSLKKLDDWIKTFKEGLTEKEKQIPILIVGGKLDLQEKRSVLAEDTVNLLKSDNLFDHIECSAKSGENVELVFETLVRKMLENTNLN